MKTEKMNFPMGQILRKLQRAYRWKLVFLLLFTAWMGVVLSMGQAEATFITCGNGVVEKFEQCDDGNLQNGDGFIRITLKKMMNTYCEELYYTDRPVLRYVIIKDL